MTRKQLWYRDNDMRSIGNADSIAEEASKDLHLYTQLIKNSYSDIKTLRARSMDALEKASKINREFANLNKKEFFKLAKLADQKEVKWHLALIIPRLKLNSKEAKKIFNLLSLWRRDKSKIVQVNSLQGMFDLSQTHSIFKIKVEKILFGIRRSNSPSLKARARILLGNKDF